MNAYFHQNTVRRRLLKSINSDLLTYVRYVADPDSYFIKRYILLEANSWSSTKNQNIQLEMLPKVLYNFCPEKHIPKLC